jgi:hypothetical protein
MQTLWTPLLPQKSPAQQASLVGSQVSALEGPDWTGRQVAAHLPLLVQTCPPPQVPQVAPHWSGPQLLPAQFGVQHAPLWQVWPGEHTFPHVPQFWTSDCVSTQAPALVGPASAGQHVWVAGHRLPLPQIQLLGPPPDETQLLPRGPQSVPVQQTPVTQVLRQQR